MAESDLKAFIREITLRHERASRETNRWLRVAEQRTNEMIRRTDEMIAELRDLRAESQAQRAALLRVLDRLGPSGAQPT